MSDKEDYSLEARAENGNSNQERLTKGKFDFRVVSLSILFYLSFFLGVAYYKSDLAARLIETYWWAIILLALPAVGLPFFPAFRQWFSDSGTAKQCAFVVFVIVPVIVGAILLVETLGEDFKQPLVRIIFYFAVCIFPASLYYLFIASRRASLKSEYHTRIGRLGLLNRRSGEDDRLYEIRRRSYWERFHSVYGFGPVRDEQRDNGRKNDETLFSAETAIPIVIATVLIAIGWFVTLPPLQSAIVDASAPGNPWHEVLLPNIAPVQYAFLGAYFFSIQMLFRRYIREDLGANAYVAVSLRIVLAVIAVWIAQTAAVPLGFEITTADGEYKEEFLILAFAIGVFPKILMQLVKGVMKKVPGVKIALPSAGTDKAMQLSLLDGLTIWHESRLEEEDIENIPNMATADIVELMLSTRFPPYRIVDWVDQSILYRHVDNEIARKILRRKGIRCASALVAIYEDDPQKLENILSPTLGVQNNQSGETPIVESLVPNLHSLVLAIQQSPYLDQIQHWRKFKINTAADQPGGSDSFEAARV